MSTEMTRLAKKYATKFQLALGDNFYFKGVTDVDDKRFKVCRSQTFVSAFSQIINNSSCLKKDTYEDVFNSEQLKDTPWFMLLGISNYTTIRFICTVK